MAGILTDRDFSLFSKLIYEHSGIHFSQMNRSILETRLGERMKQSAQANLDHYYRYLLSNQEEMKMLLDSVTTNLTRFFRNTGHFETLEKFVIPDLVAYKTKTRNTHVRIWSAGCATGEEPYSIAFVMKEKLPRPFTVELIASDLSLKSLMIAQQGYYPENKLEGVPPAYVAKYFEKKDQGYQVISEIKNLVKFDYHNLKYDSGLKHVDIVFCRNVIIYFDEAAQKAVVNRFWNIMSPHSFLFLGHSESLFGMHTSFEFVKTNWSVIYRKFTDERGGN
ncbi:MAG TPA: protein-glutamate O-methyltransferase CheR [Spirochaetia bacterium]|nr:protein-glutamate O-methyltransferase CheR [Spirochaetia bacterium]